ncbi:MAG: outer membrane beta-barrel protein [Roseivirga sp.]
MMKRLLLFIMATTLCVATVQGQPRSKSRVGSASDEFKLGLQTQAIFFHKTGIYGEYKLNEQLGLQASLLYFWDFYLLSDLKNTTYAVASVLPQYISIPLILRIYPGEGRQFCLFGGIQASYLYGGKMLLMDRPSDPFGLLTGRGPREQQTEISIAEAENLNLQVNKWGFHIVTGFDYEYKCGFILGAEYTKGLSTALDCEESFLNWTLQLALGWNFLS